MIWQNREVQNLEKKGCFKWCLVRKNNQDLQRGKGCRFFCFKENKVCIIIDDEYTVLECIWHMNFIHFLLIEILADEVSVDGI